MEIRQIPVFAMEIHGAKNLDPITVYVHDYMEGKGLITITCFGTSFSGYWGGMGNRTMMQFFVDCDYCYLLGKMMPNNYTNKKKEREDAEYYSRMICAVQDAFKLQLQK